jgi:hypothetical protein
MGEKKPRKIFLRGLIYCILISNNINFFKAKHTAHFFDMPQIDLTFGVITLNNNYCKMTFEFQISLSLVIFK